MDRRNVIRKFGRFEGCSSLDMIEYYKLVHEQQLELEPSSNLYTPKYNNREQEEIVKDCMKNYKFKKGMLITLHLPSYLTFGRFSKVSQRIQFKNPDDYYFQIEQILTRFYRRLERKIYKTKSGKNDTRRLIKFSVIEGCYNKFKRNHIHTVVEIPPHLSYEEFEILVKKSHGSFVKNLNLTNHIRQEYGITKDYSFRKMFELGKIHIRKLDLLRPYESHLRLFTYLTKEVKKDRYTVSFKNNFHERKCVRHKKKIKKPIITLEDFGIKVYRSWDREENTVDWEGLNDWVSRKRSSVLRLKQLNESISRLPV
tara:strand:+ start:378 stop:1313 length:936 start_codon:yes stop_codon:yes gene_type:complete